MKKKTMTETMQRDSITCHFHAADTALGCLPFIGPTVRGPFEPTDGGDNL